MTDCFALLDEPRRPWLDADSLKSKFFALSSEVHPDRVHSASETEKLAANRRSSELNAAYQCLREPRSRIRHLLELQLNAKPSDLTNVPDDLMELFFAVGKQFREVDAFLTEKTKATSPLLQVQLFERGMDRVDQLQAVSKQIVPRRDALLEELKSFDANWQSHTDRLLNIWRLLSFYERWLAQIQERIAQLSF